MEKFQGFDAPAEEQIQGTDKIRLTKKVISRLALWGLVSVSPLIATESKAQDLNSDKPVISGELSGAEKATLFEHRYESTGLISIEKKHEVPVIVVTTRESIEANYSEGSGPIRATSSILAEELKVHLVGNENIQIVERDTGPIRAIIKEAKLGATGLINPDEVTELGNWLSSDYYVVSSVEKDGDKYVMQNEVIDMSDGSSNVVAVETDDQYSGDSIQELAQKTEEIIRQAQLSKQNEQK